ncbi:hypothetical protein GRS48_05395 [Halorubrum sp. JWXQ-INN 858]|uniref:hypothetical protein n=1 Tax=Halorubrum sp. JWXQ-INN 858 TaxID=2690782 RepID=UPI00135767B4|nr:hypothetical protein [Halorubrum sp. JWXQ-INN 858]MWV64260.1 hypothetical protein [Halorubrum sp. JWXQ-INN 858]
MTDGTAGSSMTDGTAGRRIAFETRDASIRVRDRLAGVDLVLETDGPPDLKPALTEVFPFPADRAVGFKAESISLPSCAAATVREPHGELIAHLQESMDLPAGTYCFDVTGVTKSFLRVSDVSVSATGVAEDGPLTFEFGEPTRVVLGARSLHTRPEATITVPDDPEALMTAVSTLGSSIKEFSPERSWPTLRGYPPRIERGERLDVPDGLGPPDTGIRITVPPTYANVYRVAPLAYYLGATVAPRSSPALHLDTGYVEPLPADGDALERRVETLLGSWLFLDSLVRMEGYVPSDRHEYEQVGPALPFYPPNLADRSPSERLMEYLEVSPSVIEPYLPNWPTRAAVRPGPDAMPLLTHLAHVLAPIRVREVAAGWADAGWEGTAWRETDDAPVGIGLSPWRPSTDWPPAGGDPVPPGTGVLSSAAYENVLDRDRTMQGRTRLVFLTDSTDRERDFRRAMGDDAPPDGVGSWEVIAHPDERALAEVFGDSTIDLVYCDLPTDGSWVSRVDGADRVGGADRVDGMDGANAGGEAAEGVRLGGLDDAPAAVVFEGDRGGGGVRAGQRLVANGAIATVSLAGTLEANPLRTLVGLLASGTPIGAALALVDRPETTAARFVGDPSATAVATADRLAKSVVDVRSVAPDAHEVTRLGVPSIDSRVGAEVSYLAAWAGERPELIGTVRDDYPRLSTAEVLAEVPEPDSVVRLNGTVLFEADDVSEAEVVRSARRALDDEDGRSVGFGRDAGDDPDRWADVAGDRTDHRSS